MAAFIALWFFITRNPCRVVTTSVDQTQLEGVLWGEIRRFIQTSKFPLSVGEGGPLLVNHLHLRQVNAGKIDGISYMIGRVAAKGEGMLGHHIAETGDGIPRTLFLADEACHDDQTEVLTEKGFKYFKDLDGSEKFLTVDPAMKGGWVKYLPATHIYRSYRKGPMVEYRGPVEGGNFCVTPNHRMLWRRQSNYRLFLETIDGIDDEDRLIPESMDLKDKFTINRRDLRTVDYEGYVYCVTVPPHNTIFTRRHGACMWGGNSGCDDTSFQRSDTWARRKLIIGNPYPCENFFRKGVEGGDIKSGDGSRYYRKVIRITGHDSPNVRLSKHRLSQGLKPIVTVPGVLPYDDYIKRLQTWDSLQISVGIDAQFYQGSEVQLYPIAWLEHSHRLQSTVGTRYPERVPKAMGVDPAEGGDTTCWCIIDEYGILDIVSMKTPNTNVIVQTTLKLMLQHKLHSTNVLFDAGGGGRQIVDQLTNMGHLPRTVNFGDAVVEEPKRGMKTVTEKAGERTSKQAFKNMRAQMYGELRERMNPEGLSGGFAIPRGGVFDELRRQMIPIPMMTDAEGKLIIPPKNKPSPGSTVVTLTQLIGRSPDEADSLVLALHSLLHKRGPARAGAGKK